MTTMDAQSVEHQGKHAFHIPVLLREVLQGLRCSEGGLFLDGTLGCAGHARAILEQHPQNRLIGLDRDGEALRIAADILQPYQGRFSLSHQRFETFEDAVRRYWAEQGSAPAAPAACFDGVLLDLGVSSVQLDRAERGFSFQQPARLDMRMNQRDPHSAYDLVNTASAEELADIFYQYGEERQSRRIAAKLIEARRTAPIETTTQLADLVYRAIPRRFHPKHIHPATRVFQALRIAVNRELHDLGETLERLTASLKPGGRICVIAFHSLEDRIVKRMFRQLAKGCTCPPDFPICVCGKTPALTLVTRKPLTAGSDEAQRNPRARSAKLRVAEKI